MGIHHQICNLLRCTATMQSCRSKVCVLSAKSVSICGRINLLLVRRLHIIWICMSEFTKLQNLECSEMRNSSVTTPLVKKMQSEWSGHNIWSQWLRQQQSYRCGIVTFGQIFGWTIQCFPPQNNFILYEINFWNVSTHWMGGSDHLNPLTLQKKCLQTLLDWDSGWNAD